MEKHNICTTEWSNTVNAWIMAPIQHTQLSRIAESQDRWHPTLLVSNWYVLIGSFLHSTVFVVIQWLLEGGNNVWDSWLVISFLPKLMTCQTSSSPTPTQLIWIPYCKGEAHLIILHFSYLPETSTKSWCWKREGRWEKSTSNCQCIRKVKLVEWISILYLC